MLWADYGSVATHYWTIQYRIGLARLSSRAEARHGSEDEDTIACAETAERDKSC